MDLFLKFWPMVCCLLLQYCCGPTLTKKEVLLSPFATTLENVEFLQISGGRILLYILYVCACVPQYLSLHHDMISSFYSCSSLLLRCHVATHHNKLSRLLLIIILGKRVGATERLLCRIVAILDTRNLEKIEIRKCTVVRGCRGTTQYYARATIPYSCSYGTENELSGG